MTAKPSSPAPVDLAAVLSRVADSNERLTVSLEALRAELRASRERKATTRRVKSARRAATVGEFPVDDLSAAAARRAIARVKIRGGKK